VGRRHRLQLAAMSASGGYGTTKIAAGMVGFAELTLGARIRETLEAQVAAGSGILRGLRYCMPWDQHEEMGKYVVLMGWTPPDGIDVPKWRC
jgi:L-fuconolactonase